jgi:hypothetical protein
MTSQVRQEFINMWFVRSSFLKFDIQIKFFFSCHHVHVKATLNDDRKYYKKWIVDSLRKIFSWREISVIDVKDMRSSMIECSRCTSIRYSLKHDVRDVFRYDARRVFENVLLLITLTMFSVCSFLRQMFVSESKRHVNVITCCDKFEHDISSSTKIHQCIVCQIILFEIRHTNKIFFLMSSCARENDIERRSKIL